MEAKNNKSFMLKFNIVNSTHDEIILTCSDTELIQNVKERLFIETNENWPTNFVKKEDVAKIRFMYRGLELKDNSRVIDCNFVTEYKDEEGIT
mgnify:CR=1 FL=1